MDKFDVRAHARNNAQKWVEHRNLPYSDKPKQGTMLGMVWGEILNHAGGRICAGMPGGCHGFMSGGYYDRDGQMYDPRTGNYIDRPDEKKVGYTISSYIGPDFTQRTYGGIPVPEDVQRRWVGWWVSDDNPLSRFLVERDPDFVYNYGMIVNSEANWAQCLFLVKGFRQTNETPSLVTFWDELVTKYGVDPLIALAGAHMYPLALPTGERTYNPDCHRAIFSSSGMDFGRMLMRDDLSGTSNETASIWKGGTRRYMVTGTQFDALRKTKKTPNGWGGEVITQGATVEDIAKFLLDQEDKARVRVGLPPRSEPVKPKPVVVAIPAGEVNKKPRKMVRDKVTGLMRPARKRKVLVNGIVSTGARRTVAR